MYVDLHRAPCRTPNLHSCLLSNTRASLIVDDACAAILSHASSQQLWAVCSRMGQEYDKVPGGSLCSWSDSVLRTTSLPCLEACPSATGALDISIPSSSTSSGSLAVWYRPLSSSVVVLYGPDAPPYKHGTRNI